MESVKTSFDLTEDDISIETDMENIMKKFPYLKMYNVFAEGPALAGPVCLPSVLGKRQRIREKESIFVSVIYKDYPNYFAKIYDVERKIDWDLVPYKHRHDNGNGLVCTHHNIELMHREPCKRTYLSILNVIRIFLAVEQYKKDSTWVLDELPHGDEGTKQILKELGSKQGYRVRGG